ncbi:response regulator [uncultured Clostridium sp.]|uniref:response regulator n=1 Tax=uncultured Clostridium sp. TaxID=59620 RepID=UPI0025D81508|nr:response regulator [uncultured Clostridium sp.]
MKHDSGRNIKKKIALTAILVGGILAFITFFFVQAVKTQLWNQSINTIMESTAQGCTTLRVQLQEAYEGMADAVTLSQDYSAEQKKELETALGSPVRKDRSIVLYLPDGTCIPSDAQQEEGVKNQIWNEETESGIIDPHISSVTGVNVFDLFVKAVLSDGTQAYLVREYEVDGIVDSFTLSFYNNEGFSYIVNASGDVLIRPPHPGSNKTIKNVFDMLSDVRNSPEEVETFRNALEGSGKGWTVFTYQGEKNVFCFTPLKLGSDWYLISIIPQDTVNAQTHVILMQTLVLVSSIILGLFILVLVYFRYINRTNRRLRNQADYIGHLYNAVPEGIALITVEKPHRFIQLNKEGLHLLEYPDGASNDAPEGKCLQDVIYPDDYEKMEALCEIAATGGGKSAFEYRMMRKDETLFWIAGIIEKTLDETGEDVLIATFHDITEEKLAEEEEKQEHRQELLTLVGAISNAYPVIIRLNLTQDTLNFVYVKSGLMVNLGNQETYSQLFEDFANEMHPDNCLEFQSRFSLEMLRERMGKETGEVFLETRQKMMDGKFHWISIQIINVDNPYSDDKLAILISRRIDEQKYEQEQQRLALQSALDSARAASSAKSQFLSNMSHDIRTPMNAITGMAAIAAIHLDDRERVMECLRKISLSSNHLLSLINDVLDMSKIESGKISLRNEPFNFAGLVADCVELVQSQVSGNQFEFKVQLMSLKNENVIGDPLRIRQICINILSNAVKYTLPGGRISVKIWQEDIPGKHYRNFMFRCSDTGVGMDHEFLDRIFQPFERLQDPAVSKVAGTGLGMAITKNIVDLMNGDIQVESRPGVGSTFTVTFPLQPQNIQEEEVPEEWLGVRSLVVDDDRQTCENAAELLQSMGLRAQFATDGATGVQSVIRANGTSDPFELVILDWKMPDMDGVEAARRIRKSVGPDVPVIILTAYDWSEIENEARDAGVTAFLSKPFYRSKLCYLLGEIKGGKELKKQEDGKSAPDYRGRRLLLVEDNEINREIARTLVEEMGMTVEEAVNGREAVDRVADSPEGYYSMIFMDIQMPVMDGYEAARRIRSLGREDAKSVPIIAMTANAFEEDVRAALRAGMDAHFSKPVDYEKLKELMRRYLG